MAQKQADSYNSLLTGHSMAAATNRSKNVSELCPISSETSSGLENERDSEQLSAAVNSKCYFCGLMWHPCAKRPAREYIYNKCSKMGHRSEVCKSSKSSVPSAKHAHSAATHLATIVATSDATVDALKKVTITVKINGTFTSLIDSGSSESFIDMNFVHLLKLPILPGSSKISMAFTEFSAPTLGDCETHNQYGDHEVTKVKLGVMGNLCADVILGHNVLRQLSYLEMKFGGPTSSHKICSFASADVQAPYLFITVKIANQLPTNQDPIRQKTAPSSNKKPRS
jgi:hypothetical protein